MRKDIREGVRFYIMNDIKPNFAQMARQYDSDPRTIKKHFEEQQNPELIKPRKPVLEKASKLDPYRTLIDEKVSEGCSATAIYSLLKRRGYEGKITILRDYCRTLKQTKTKKATIRIETNPGLSAQVDWKENMTLYTSSGRPVTFNIFLYVLGYSRMKYLELTFEKKQDTLFMCLNDAFYLTGGVPREIWFDNMKTVVNHAKSQYKKVVFHDTFYAFSKDASFQPIACRPFRPQTKGKVEALARTCERLRVMNGEFDDELELCHYVHDLAEELNYEVSQATGQRPIDLWEHEKEHLQAFDFELLAEYSCDDIRRIVSTESMVQFRTSKYSVPIKYIGEEVEIRLTTAFIHIYYNGELIQTHPISEKKRSYTYDTHDAYEILKSDVFKHKEDEEIYAFIENSLAQYDDV